MSQQTKKSERRLEREPRETPYLTRVYRAQRDIERLCLTDREAAIALSNTSDRLAERGIRAVSAPTLSSGVGEILSHWRVEPRI